MINSTAIVQAGKTLLAQANSSTIPYVAGGMTLQGMDCQGLVEYLLIKCGIAKSDCNLAGSNAHWRNSLSWRGTPEEAVKQFGSVPVGAALFILEDSGEPSKYAGDGMGNASHMGLNLGGGVAIHASESKHCVCESPFANKTIRNGGWNRVGLLEWVDYGVGDFDDTTANDTATGDMDSGDTTGTGSYIPAFEPYYATVHTPDGNPVKMRQKPSKTCNLYFKVPNGEQVLVIAERVREGISWRKVHRGDRKWYIMTEFLRRVGD